jgi:ribosome-binding protein aMBF1 (putative translation factor)
VHPQEPEPARDEVHEASLKGMGRAVAIIRERREMSREELAPRCELTLHELEAIERGELHEQWGGLRKIAEALGVALPTLIVEAEERAPGPGGEKWRQGAGKAEPGSDTGGTERCRRGGGGREGRRSR